MEVLNQMWRLESGLSTERQEDVQQYLHAVIDLCHEDEKEYDTSSIREAFEGYIRTESICGACGWRSDQLESFKHLPLAFRDAHDVEAALRMKTAKQSVCDATCPGCNRKGHRTRTDTILEAPRVLALHLLRFDSDTNKLSKSCSYPDILDIEPYMSTSNTRPTASTEDDNLPSTLYRLYAVVCHIGQTIHHGHYLAWVKTGEGKWAKMNDSSVIEADQPFACEEDGYMFFYERIDGAETEVLRARLKTSQAAAERRRQARQKLANIRGSPAVATEGWTTAMAQKRTKKEQPKADNGLKEKREKHGLSGKGKGERKGKKQTKMAR
ncbi:cysteine proteinase [Schizophyllum commune Tattone D]|nr:cysteine proteinase [Schizophyllum commune Tattone D]